jgi:hypothetical protein
MDGSQFGLSTEDSPYYHFNSICRKRDSDAVERWADFSCLFCSALDKLPSEAITVFRGLNVPLSQVSHEYKTCNIWLLAHSIFGLALCDIFTEAGSAGLMSLSRCCARARFTAIFVYCVLAAKAAAHSIK